MKRKPSHPGRIFLEEFLKPKGVSLKLMAYKTGLSVQWLEDFCKERALLDKEKAKKIATFMGTTYRFWLNLNKNYQENNV